MLHKRNRCVSIYLLLMLFFFSTARADSHMLQIQTNISAQTINSETVQTLVVHLLNSSDQPIRNLSLQNFLPPELIYDGSQSAGLLINEIPANGSAQTVFTIRPLRNSLKQDVAQNVLGITIESDQQSYQYKQSAKVTITVQNLTNQVLSNLQIKHLFPDGLGLSDASKSNTLQISSLKPFEVYQCDVFVHRLSDLLYVTATLDHAVYRKGDLAKITVHITNESIVDATNVTLSNILPNGFRYAATQKNTFFSYPCIRAGESVEETLLVEIIDTSFLPQTGDRPIWPVALLGTICILLLAYLLRNKRSLED